MEKKPFVSREEGAKARQKKRNEEVITAEVVTLDVEQIISATVARFNTVPKTDYKAIAAPYRDLDPVKLSDPQLLKEVEEARKKLKNDRVMIERLRKELKEDSLKTGRAIDLKAKELTEPITEPEQYLEDLVERFKNHQAEQERLKAEALKRLIAGRIAALAQYGHIISYDEVIVLEELDFQELLQEKKAEFEMAQALKDAEEKRKAQELKAQEEERKEFEQKQTEMKLREDTLWLREAKLETARPIRVPASFDINLVNSILGDDYGVAWAYENDGVIWEKDEPVTAENQSSEPPKNWLTDELEQIAPPPPVQVNNDVPADDANILYGERYGIDWVYEEQPEPVATPDDEKPLSNARNLSDDFFEALSANVASTGFINIELTDEQAAILSDRSELQIVAQLIRQIQQPTLISEKAKPFNFNQKMSALLEWMESF